ncbi:GDSL-type esterase/lipase family protein [Catenulispora pinisilvae]|uniref:GDSL-type esterase/lipase family protein n=1 Tax=Catenulispora pinisilvae TaxID=2705253 RepID=UPI001891DB91|nr:GDSL-type esterase/lipase family protein [Catenulispora pinisilvae]
MSAPRIMILGDSLASGMQDDYTWRWQLAQHFRHTGTAAEFVGPHTGTFSMYEDPVLLALVEGRPAPTGPGTVNPMTGRYREGRFEGGHCARPGWTAHAAKASVRRHVAAHCPDFLLVQLGFNDLATLGPPEQTLRDLTAVVTEARSAAPAVAVLVASITGTTWGNAWFRKTVEDYNAELPATVSALATDQSPVALVNLHDGFDPDTHTYDGIHPNPTGESAMAAGFAHALRRFGVGHDRLRPCRSRLHELPLQRPTILAARTQGDTGVRLEWSRVRGASAYRVALRDVTLGQPRRLGPIPVLGDHWLVQGLTAGHVYEFDVASARGERLGPRSEPVRATAGS